MDYVALRKKLIIHTILVFFVATVIIALVHIDPYFFGLHPFEEVAELIIIIYLLYHTVNLTYMVDKTVKALKQKNLDYQKLLENQKRVLQNTSHELKMPIAKGKFALELLKDDPEIYTQKLQKIFLNMEKITEDILLSEKLDTIDAKFTFEDIYPSALVYETLNYMLVEPIDERIKIDLEEDFLIKCNVKYMPVALKNLLDNGMKYSNNNQVVLKISQKAIEIISQGDALKKDLEYYIKPFTRDEERFVLGYGLGLYITNRIITSHGYNLIYTHQDGKNSFRILF
ncbi:MAG: ATP-binding protein [Arcobacteraceae bacterium]